MAEPLAAELQLEEDVNERLPAQITNGLICDLRQSSASDASCLEKLIGPPYFLIIDDTERCRESTRKKIGDVFRTFKNLKKTKKLKDSFMETPFVVPKQKSQSHGRLSNYSSSITGAIDRLTEKLTEEKDSHKITREALEEVQLAHKESITKLVDQLQSNTDLHDETVEEFETRVVTLENDIKRHLSTDVKKDREIDTLHSKLIKKDEKIKQFDIKNTNRSLKRKNDAIDRLKEENKKLKVDVISLKKDFEELVNDKSVLNEKIESLKKSHLANLKRKSKLKRRLHQLLLSNSGVTVSDLQKQNDQQEKDIRDLEEYVSFLEDDNSTPLKISTFENGKYSNLMREVCMTLLTECNISINKLPRAVDVVLSKLAGLQMTRAPSAATLSRFMTDANIIAYSHVSTEMLAKKDASMSEGRGHVLQQDATTKFHKHYEGMQVTLENGKCLSMGLRQVAGGDAETYVEAFNDIIDDLAASCDGDKEAKRAQLITSFKAFMNDRCAVNGVFTEQVERLRESLLPAVIKNFHQLNEQERADIIEMGHFACKMHLLSNFASAAEKAAVAFEECFSPIKNPFSLKRAGASEGVNLVMTAAKAFSERGCDKSGVNSYFESFLNGRSRKNSIKSFLGHRFNMLFSDAAAVFYHHLDIKDFLETWPAPNQLLQSVKFDVDKCVFLALVRALGIFGKLIGEPLEAILKSKSKILELNEVLKTIQETLSLWSTDGSIAMAGAPIFRGFTHEINEVFKSLFLPSENLEFDSLTAVAIEIICGHILILLERQASEQLPGGELWEPTDNLKKIASCVPPTNIASERDMSKLDNLVKWKPSASVASLETHIMWQTNKTSLWLNSLDNHKKETILEMARTKAPELKKRLLARKNKLKNDLAAKLIKKQNILKVEGSFFVFLSFLTGHFN